MKTVLYAEKLVESYPVKSRSQQIIDNEYNIERSCVDFSSFIEQWIKYSLMCIITRSASIPFADKSYEKWVFLHVF